MKKLLLLAVACISLLSCTEDSILNNWSFGFPGSPKITASKSSLTFSSDGGTENITINSNFTWKMISKPEWIKVSPSSSAKGTTEVTITAEANNASEAKGTIVLGEPATSTTLSIEVGIDDKISADVTSLDFSGDGESQVVSITSNFNWQVLSKPEWITISPSSGSNGTTNLTITAEKSASTSVRTETLTIGKESSATVSITVNQAAATADVVDDVESDVESETFTVNGVSFKMIKVEGGTFEMGPDQLNNSNHSVTLSTYYIGETEVPYDLWEAVMGLDNDNNPEEHTNGPAGRYPVNRVTWDRCQEFVTKLSSLTGKTFRLPTEAEWMYAARGGNRSKGYMYSGSNDIEEVAWYKTNSHDLENGMYDPDWGTHAVARKKPNELGLYDMTGNLCEWTLGYDSNNEAYICRGGCWWSDAWDSRIVNSSTPYKPDVISVNIGFRIVMTDSSPVNNTSSETFNVSGVSFKMIKVEGGTFTMGGTSEQGADASYPELPTHSVTLSTYYIGETEVTQELWETVMGNNPSYSKSAKKPVEQFSFENCQIFITKLSSVTGRNFRLPTEAEWEYAARGGNKSKGYKYSGSNNIDDVAWYDGNSGLTKNVAQKAPNELGLYDMSGNVWEWCQDYWSDRYSSGSQTNPTGPSSGTERVLRGGGSANYAKECRVSCRVSEPLDWVHSQVGFRLVMTK